MLPIQKLPLSKKNEEWRKECIDALEQLYYGNVARWRADVYRKRVNYDLFNGKFNRKDMEYVTNPFGLGIDETSFPANLQHYDIISPDLLLLMGEESKRPFNFRVVSEGSSEVSMAMQKKRELVQMYIESLLFDKEQQQIMDPTQINKYMKYTYRDIKEKTAQELLDYLARYENLESKFNDGWKDVLVAGEEIYYIGESGGQVYVELCNPLDIFYVIDDNSTDISEASAISYRRFMTLSQIVDMFYEDLSTDDLVKLETMVNAYSGGTIGSNTGSTVNYIPQYIKFNTDAEGNVTSSANGTNANVGRGTTIPVLRCEWKSLKKIGVLSYVDEQGQPQETIVPEVYKPAEGETVEWHWISEWWEGVKIASDIYVNIRPKAIQRRSMDNISVCRPGFVGKLYNARNSQSVSLIDRMKPYQYLYNIVYYRLELGLAKSKGKVMIMDITQIPSNPETGWDIQKWLYYFETLGIAFIDPLQAPEGKGEPSHFNQYTAIDMELGSFIDKHVMLLDKIEDRMSQLSGVSRQRRGQITSEDGLGTSDRAVTQSSHITEYWFKKHNDVKRDVLTAMLDVAKHFMSGSKKLQFITDDMGKVFFDIDGDDFSNTEYGVFVSNSSKDERLLESLRNLSQVALQYDKATLSDIVSIMESNSIVEIKRKLEQAETEAQQRIQQSQESEQQSQQQLVQMQIEDKEKDRALKKYEIDSNNETKIQVETIRTYIGQQEDKDLNDDGIADPIELQKLALEERKLKADQMAAQLGLASEERDRMHQAVENEKDRGLEREKMKNDIQLAKMKPKPKPAAKK